MDKIICILKGGEKMDKQTTIYLSDKDMKRLELVKELFETNKTNEVIKILIKEEYDRIKKYRDLI